VSPSRSSICSSDSQCCKYLECHKCEVRHNFKQQAGISSLGDMFAWRVLCREDCIEVAS
jgi:hypothetical protein